MNQATDRCNVATELKANKVSETSTIAKTSSAIPAFGTGQPALLTKKQMKKFAKRNRAKANTQAKKLAADVKFDDAIKAAEIEATLLFVSPGKGKSKKSKKNRIVSKSTSISTSATTNDSSLAALKASPIKVVATFEILNGGTPTPIKPATGAKGTHLKSAPPATIPFTSHDGSATSSSSPSGSKAVRRLMFVEAETEASVPSGSPLATSSIVPFSSSSSPSTLVISKSVVWADVVEEPLVDTTATATVADDGFVMVQGRKAVKQGSRKPSKKEKPFLVPEVITSGAHGILANNEALELLKTPVEAPAAPAERTVAVSALTLAIKAADAAAAIHAAAVALVAEEEAVSAPVVATVVVPATEPAINQEATAAAAVPAAPLHHRVVAAVVAVAKKVKAKVSRAVARITRKAKKILSGASRTCRSALL